MRWALKAACGCSVVVLFAVFLLSRTWIVAPNPSPPAAFSVDDASGVVCETCATVVSAYYQVSSKHSVDEYRRWLANFLLLEAPVVLYTDAASHASVLAPLLGASAKRNLRIEFVEMPAFHCNSLGVDWNRQHALDPEHDRQSAALYQVWNEKIHFVRLAAERNPFNTRWFAWTDSGSFRGHNNCTAVYAAFPRADRLVSGRVSVNLISGVVRHPKKASTAADELPRLITDRDVVAGGFIFGDRAAFESFHTLYYGLLARYAARGTFVGKEQLLLTACLVKQPDLFVPYVIPSKVKQPYFYPQLYYSNSRCDEGVQSRERPHTVNHTSNEALEVVLGDPQLTRCKGRLYTPHRAILALPGGATETHLDSADAVERIRPLGAKFLMVVGHADDEVLFGGRDLLHGPRGAWVVAVANTAGKGREPVLPKIVDWFGLAALVAFEHTDRIDLAHYDARFVRDLAALIGLHPWEKVVTHGEAGEYGHGQHRALHVVMAALVGLTHEVGELRAFEFLGEDAPLNKSDTYDAESGMLRGALALYGEKILGMFEPFIQRSPGSQKVAALPLPSLMTAVCVS